MQSRRQPLVESLVSVAIGFVVALLSQLAIFPLFGIDRGYAVRRMFATWHRRSI